eukprot:Phypoly_transcript_05533.p2 GENE.Phypoly_transcript_05533~~Phypoly_transcript_05533.p2  ORF type:complete len:218 (+),score=62.22 Phypoly_transcript_05533:1219-1872(+)
MVDGCIYLGCRYPANKDYFRTIYTYSKKVGRALAKKGVRGFLGVDYLANQKDDGGWDIYALEINLRLCATTFSYFLLLTAVQEKKVPQKHYVMLDELKVNKEIASFRQLDKALSKTGLAFDPKKGRGVLLATCGCIATRREASVLIVADSRGEVDTLLDTFLEKFAHEERAHFASSRSNTPVAPSHLGNESNSHPKAEKAKGKSEVQLNEQGVEVKA